MKLKIEKQKNEETEFEILIFAKTNKIDNSLAN